MPKSEKTTPTEWSMLSEWVECLATSALSSANLSLRLSNRLSLTAAKKLQFAIIANLLVGTTVPPLRAYIVRTVQVPSSQYTCQDEDCLHGRTCQGNRFLFQGCDNTTEGKPPFPLKTIFPSFKHPHTYLEKSPSFTHVPSSFTHAPQKVSPLSP